MGQLQRGQPARGGRAFTDSTRYAMNIRCTSSRAVFATLAALALVSGCATGTPGQDDTTYYVQGRQGQPAPAVAPVIAPAAPGLSGRGPVGVTRIVYFDFDKYEVKPQYKGVVQAHAEYLRGRPQGQVLLEGHTDVRGGSEYNLALGQRRAEAVNRLLQHGGAMPRQTETVSWGMEKPADSGSTEAAHQSNRRVEFIYR